MQLSMALNQYRSHVEQLAYYDPVYAVGTGSKYLRDAKYADFMTRSAGSACSPASI